ncbi:hypothetical protein [Halioxenophilus sp. WMMB6]|uniref:hypothetical protein n=1 Tax=Halioxenophilus sp. WMMB6 TaxID=3073815 RepID=UPI00295E5A5B|nr:hypothetical protein [Halioxenophilus sp. WMMB6]
MDGWDKFKVVSAVLVPAAIALVGHWYTSAIAEREIQAKFVELGVSILQAPPNKETANLRTWAIEVLNRYSGVPLNEATRKDLIENVPIPTADRWSEAPPVSGWCYQEDSLKPGPQQFSVHCHWSEPRCNEARGPNARTRQSACTLVDLAQAQWQPNAKGWQGSWFEFRAQPFPPPFPPLP